MVDKKFDIVCVGFVTQDILLKNISEDALRRDSTYASETVVSVGGDAANQAVVLKRLGVSTALVVNMGEDPIGEQIYSMLSRDGVDLSYSIRSGIKRSNLSVAVIKPDGSRSFLFGKGEGNLDVSLDDIDLSVLDRTRAVSLGSLYFLKNMDGEGATELFKKAKQKHVLTFADMTTDAYSVGPDKIAPVYEFTDYLMPSYEEASYTTGKTDLDEVADYFLERGVGSVIVKLGDKGCFVKNAKERFYTDPFDVQAVDTTGCGDNFCAGFIAGVLSGWTLEESARFGAAAGAVNACRLGAHDTVRSREQLFRFMEETPQTPVSRLTDIGK